MTAEKPQPQQRIADPDERIINLDKFLKKLERYVNGEFAFSDGEKKDTIEELTDLVFSCCTTSSAPFPEPNMKYYFDTGYEKGAKVGREQGLDEFMEELRKEEYDNYGYVDMDSIEAVYVRVYVSLKESLRAHRERE